MADLAASQDITLAGSLCHFLSHLFITQPDEALLASCRDGAAANLLADIASDPAFGAGARRLTDAVLATDPTLLGRAWTLLFSGAGGPATVPPYASAHQEGRLYGAATARMQDLMATLDVSIAAHCAEPADHIAIQMAVLAVLLADEDVAAAERFRRTELAWVPGFCRLCADADPTGFYAGAALLLAAVAQPQIPPLEPDAQGENRLC